jgi:hypothetical protein
MARAIRSAAESAPDVVNTVQGQIRLYDCPDITSVDNYLCELARRVERSASLPKLQAQYRADQDSLLDRRLWLEMTGEPNAIED